MNVGKVLFVLLVLGFVNGYSEEKILFSQTSDRVNGDTKIMQLVSGKSLQALVNTNLHDLEFDISPTNIYWTNSSYNDIVFV